MWLFAALTLNVLFIWQNGKDVIKKKEGVKKLWQSRILQSEFFRVVSGAVVNNYQ